MRSNKDNTVLPVLIKCNHVTACAGMTLTNSHQLLSWQTQNYHKYQNSLVTTLAAVYVSCFCIPRQYGTQVAKEDLRKLFVHGVPQTAQPHDLLQLFEACTCARPSVEGDLRERRGVADV